MNYFLIYICIGILLGIAVGQFLQINKLWKRVNVMFDSIFTNHKRLNDIDTQIDKIYEHLSWHEDKLMDMYPQPEDFQEKGDN
tara:strand:+ start:2765 stop:3013 length:249 start_codon:yes stop_codon:yes gene_type:complete